LTPVSRESIDLSVKAFQMDLVIGGQWMGHGNGLKSQ